MDSAEWHAPYLAQGARLHVIPATPQGRLHLSALLHTLAALDTATPTAAGRLRPVLPVARRGARLGVGGGDSKVVSMLTGVACGAWRRRAR